MDDDAELQSFGAELVDRFGPLPEEVKQLLEIVAIKALCKRANVEKVEAGPKGIIVAFRDNDVWTELALPPVEHGCGILALSPTDIWIAGNDGKRSPETPTAKVAHWNGATWTVTTRPGTSKLCTLAMAGTTLYATDATSEAVHIRDASGTWTTERILASGGVAGTGFRCSPGRRTTPARSSGWRRSGSPA